MNASGWREQLALSVQSTWHESVPGLAPAQLLDVSAADWGTLGRVAKELGCRWVAGWGEDRGEEIMVNACLEKEGSYIIARTRLDSGAATLPSHALYYATADRSERHTRDLLGVHFSDHPDTRRWTRHQAWAENEYPLRTGFTAAGVPPLQTPPDDRYPFLQAQGSGVYEIPVGPVHAGIIEPGHFRFQAVGELVLNLEEHLGYVHKGIEKIAEGRDATALARLAGRVSGDCTVAHTWAACMAMEQAGSLDVPARAHYLRAIMCERERVANHLGDIGAVLNDVAFTFGFYQFARLREDWTRLSHVLFGHRFMMDRLVPGGVAADLDATGIDRMREQINALRPEVEQLIAIAEDNASIEDRLETTGYLDPALARELGTLGYVGRASGIDFDVRRDAPYPPYDRLDVTVPVYHYGDVAARVKVRGAETLAAFELIDRLLLALPDGPITIAWRPPASEVEGLGLVEGWRGEILSYVRFDASGRIARFYPRDPSWLNWPALEKLMRDNIVPDFPVCNKSVNGSYSGHDL
jgi:Ni,Fe-hydrogenase III large subunit/NADH:ubiquinone oxidoreductase subunit C